MSEDVPKPANQLQAVAGTVSTLRAPIILLGMHRSGTSLIAQLLDELGLFQGSQLQEDHESVHFLDVNDTLFKRVGASWDNPAPIRQFLAEPAAVELTVDCLTTDFTGRGVAGFLGRKKYAKYKGLAKLDRPWGWKDPRTVYTLPLWLRLFPAAKLVYIVRNGIDVASSLRVRERRELERRRKEFERKREKTGRLTRHSLLSRAGFKGSGRCLSLDGGFSLWEQYLEEADRQLAAVANERLIIHYERFLAEPHDPEHGLEAIARFCGVGDSADELHKAAGRINPGRANAFLQDVELKTFYGRVKETAWMSRYGYSQLS